MRYSIYNWGDGKMIRTVVCQKEGCSGNRFQIETIDNNIQATCRECGSKYLYEAVAMGMKSYQHVFHAKMTLLSYLEI